MSTPRIVVVGGGAGGLPLVTRLGHQLGKKGRAEITLVDASNSHVWKPRYHEVATGAIDANLDAVDYRGHARRNHYRFEPGTLADLDRQARELTLAPYHDEDGQEILPARRLAYDYLVIAVGSRGNDFGTPGVAEHCLFVDTHAQAEHFRERFLNTCLRANYHDRPISVTLVGGGATGVELAAELHHAISVLKLYGHHKLDRNRLRVTVAEAMSRLLPGLPKRVSEAARRRLEGLGVTVRTGVMVSEARANTLITRDGETLEADLLVWSAGIKAPGVLDRLDASTSKIGQLEVDDCLRVRGESRIFAIGDCACFKPEGADNPVPPRAQTAQQMARRTAANLQRLVRGRTLKPFDYKDRGSLVSLSRFNSVGVLNGDTVFVEGRLARLMYVMLYRMHQAALYGWPRTLLLLTAGRFNRLVRPGLKLH